MNSTRSFTAETDRPQSLERSFERLVMVARNLANLFEPTILDVLDPVLKLDGDVHGNARQILLRLP